MQASVLIMADGNDSVDDCAREDALFRQPLPQGRVMMADGDYRVYECAYDDAWRRQRLAQASELLTSMTLFYGKGRGTRLSMCSLLPATERSIRTKSTPPGARYVQSLHPATLEQ